MRVTNGTSTGLADISKSFCAASNFTQSAQNCNETHTALKEYLNEKVTVPITFGELTGCKEPLKCQDGCLSLKDMVEKMNKNKTYCYKDCIIMEQFSMENSTVMLEKVDDDMRRCYPQNIMTCREDEMCYSYNVDATAKVNYHFIFINIKLLNMFQPCFSWD